VRQSPQRDPNSNLYDYDLDGHVLIVSSWSHKALAYNLDLQEDVEIASILINGKGTYFVSMFSLKTLICFKETTFFEPLTQRLTLPTQNEIRN
jgi:hypothetical protein